MKTPKTIKEVGKIDLTKLCCYDRRNPDFQIKEEYGYDKEEVEETGNFSKKDCACDNCFYGRSKLIEQLIIQQEISYSEEEVKNIINDYCFDWNYNYKGELSQKKYLVEWFEQFKNK